MWKSVVGHDVSVSVETQGMTGTQTPDFCGECGNNFTWTKSGKGPACGLLLHFEGAVRRSLGLG